MKQYAKVTPEGSRDLLFEECDDRRRVENALTGLYEANGYRKVITPTLEFFDVFNSGDAGLDADEMYKLTDNRGRTTVLRPDNTLPIARLVATRLSEDAFPVRLYYNQSVFVRTKELAGRTELLFTIAIFNISRLLTDPFIQNRNFFLCRFSLKNRGVQPGNSIVIIRSQFRRSQTHASLFITRLSNIIVTGIVHNRVSRTKLLSKLRIAQRFHRDRRRTCHIVHQ